MNIDVTSLFRRQLINLGDQNKFNLEGIYSPIYDQKEVELFMSSYYETEEGVQSQVKKIDLTDYYFDLISEAIQKVNEIPLSPACILELGCGFGNATIPLLKLFPQADVIASEFSLSMLQALKIILTGENLDRKCTYLQLNAEDLDFHDNSFDMIVGAAILHHLFEPNTVIEQSARILREGGIALFFEPFENGTGILGLIYKSIINDKRFKKLKRNEKLYFKNCVNTWQNMKNDDKDAPFFKGIDDKWLFTRDYFSEFADQYGFRKYIIYPVDKSNRPFENLISSHLNGNNMIKMPSWIWEIVDEFENFFSDRLKRDLLTEGCILLIK
jgi:ubiquinone/menaquinone biosynthesis C-methylase UbiE